MSTNCTVHLTNLILAALELHSSNPEPTFLTCYIDNILFLSPFPTCSLPLLLLLYHPYSLNLISTSHTPTSKKYLDIILPSPQIPPLTYHIFHKLPHLFPHFNSNIPSSHHIGLLIGETIRTINCNFSPI
jgi:hypothetical protein